MDLAFDVAAPLVECAEKCWVFIPAWVITDFSQCPMVDGLTGLCGLRSQ